MSLDAIKSPEEPTHADQTCFCGKGRVKTLQLLLSLTGRSSLTIDIAKWSDLPSRIPVVRQRRFRPWTVASLEWKGDDGGAFNDSVDDNIFVDHKENKGATNNDVPLPRASKTLRKKGKGIKGAMPVTKISAVLRF